MFQASPHSNEALVKTTTPNMNRRRRPNLSARAPAVRISAASASA